MIDAATRALLEFAVAYIDANNTMVANTHTNPRTREIEPGSVRREVAAANAWLERARRVLRPTGEPVLVDNIPADDREGDAGLRIHVKDCRVRVDFDRPLEWIAMDADRACQFINALIVHAKIAGRKTGRPIEVKL